MSVDSDVVLNKLKTVLSDDNFDYATTVITYCETKSLVYNYIGMSEFRDALTHVKRAVNASNEQKVFSEVDSAFEHIRRAAVESMQYYVEMKYRDLKNRFSNPCLYLFISAYSIDWKEIREREAEIKDLLVCARTSKPKTEWQEAIGYFFKADEKLDSLNLIFPSSEDIRRRTSKFLFVMLIIILGIVILLKPM